MNILFILIPVTLILGGLGLFALFIAIRSDQFEDLEGDGSRILDDRHDDHPG